MKTKVFGYIPTRMGSTRLPGKALMKVTTNTLTEEVYLNCLNFKNWEALKIATCDQEIKDFLKLKNIPYVMTSKSHKRCLDRVCEAAEKNPMINEKDIIVCIQGDEVMINSKMIKKLIEPFKFKNCNSTILSMKINNKSEYYDKNVVKLITNNQNQALIGSRSAIPFMKKFKKGIAKKIVGIYAFRFKSLLKFKNTKQSFLEKIESCDTNRICETSGDLYAVDYPYQNIIAVDTIKDLKKVRRILKYKN